MSDQDTSCIHVPQQLQDSSRVNWMPFGIAFDGPASAVSEYFDPQPHQQGTSARWMQQHQGVPCTYRPADSRADQPAAFDAVEEPSTSGSNSSQWVASFRGRQLKGASKPLPAGFEGLVLKPAGASNSSSTSDAQQRSWQAVIRFSQLTLWGHDAAPAATDPHMRCIDWLALADQVHQPLSVSDVDEELKRMEAQAIS